MNDSGLRQDLGRQTVPAQPDRTRDVLPGERVLINWRAKETEYTTSSSIPEPLLFETANLRQVSTSPSKRGKTDGYGECIYC